MFNLTDNQIRWLRQHGDRRMEDIWVDEDGLYYVLMADGQGGYKRVYLPTK